jgi:hypothetical protein
MGLGGGNFWSMEERRVAESEQNEWTAKKIIESSETNHFF